MTKRRKFRYWAVPLAVALILSMAPVEAQGPTPGEGPGFEGASTCYDPAGLLTRWTQDGYVEHRYDRYFWLSNRQEGVSVVCEKFEGGLPVVAPGTATYYGFGEAGLDLGSEVTGWFGEDLDVDGDGAPEAEGPYERIIPNVGQGDVFVVHGWSQTDAYDIAFYNENDRPLRRGSYSLSAAGAGDVIGTVPAEAEYAEVTLTYAGYIEDPVDAADHPVNRFDYYEVSFDGDNLCPLERPYYRTGGDDPYMEKVRSGTKDPQGYLYLDYSYEPGSPIVTRLRLHGADDFLVMSKMELASGVPRNSEGPQIKYNGPSTPGSGRAANVSTADGHDIGFDEREDRYRPNWYNYLDTYTWESGDWGNRPGNNSLLMGTWGGGNATHSSWEVWVDTCGKHRSAVTGVSTGNASSYHHPREYESTDRGRVDVQVDNLGLPRNPVTNEGAWLQHGRVSVEANHHLWGFLWEAGECAADSYGLNWWEPWQDHSPRFPARENSCYSTTHVEADGPSGTKQWCFPRSPEGDCAVSGPAGSYDIDLTYHGTSGETGREPDGFYVLDVEHP